MPETPTLADLVAPLGVSQFFQDVQGETYRRFEGPAGRFADLLPWPALNAILRQHRLEFPRLRLALDGTPVPMESYTDLVPTRRSGTVPRLQAAPFTEHLRGGATMVLDAIQELSDPIGDLARSLEHDLRESVQVNLYAGWGVTHGFDVHWDDHDAFIIQVAGRKRWRMHGPTRPAPLHRDVEQPERPGEPIDDFVLEDGDVLYVPRGHWHDVTAVGEMSLHLTLGFSPATGIDLVSWLADKLRSSTAFRQDLPRFGTEEDRAARAAALRAELEAALTGDVVDRFLAERDSSAPAHPRVGLPWAATPGLLPDGDETEVRFLVPRAVLEEGDGRVTLLADGKRFVFAGAASPLLKALLDGTPQAVKRLAELSELDRGTVRAFLGELTTQGLLSIG
ncbi:cupin domain-containing protein [Amycolatopsis thailandensis]|uniref:Cupin n=1 Tax=Amycolatopsis thailandensis TaxID=589330 RepID=A0A229S1P3_9PSEU|nr:cupin domain-containing protein [Amycolatopsis thailandensis]OXM52828.1 cupin [Amycolatopsis thailandensis]